VKFSKKFWGEKDIEVVIQRLDQLSQEETQMTMDQTLQVIHGLLQNMRMVVDGE